MSTTSSPAPLGAAHAKRLAKWRNLAPAQTRELIDGVVQRLVPRLEAEGFVRVDFRRLDPEFPIPASEIVLERVASGHVDEVTFNFEKYRRPRMQIHGARRQEVSPHEFLRSAKLVASASQYYHFWGKPWWWPTRFWSASASHQAVGAAESCLGQLTRFLDLGERGPNISRPVHLRGAGGPGRP